MSMQNESSPDPAVHARNISGKLDELVNHVRGDISKVSDPKAKVLFETTAEVLLGLKQAYTDYQNKSEPGMR